MNKSAIFHRNDLNNIYALDKDTLRIILRTGKDVKSATLFANDPYINGISGNAPWYGKAYQMKVLYELSDNYLFYADINPDYKRLQYYFEISDDNQSVIYLEDGCHEKDFITDRFIKHYFKYGFINEADIMTVPISAKETLWYQI
ncbi:MAG: alpha amylase N-terminal ig-like domain-containing protein, partial [Succinivibrio sp.]|nr:alpha amylase N-terminal ig-like domain-containing protein [Succinivibrio sp.]